MWRQSYGLTITKLKFTAPEGHWFCSTHQDQMLPTLLLQELCPANYKHQDMADEQKPKHKPFELFSPSLGFTYVVNHVSRIAALFCVVSELLCTQEFSCHKLQEQLH